MGVFIIRGAGGLNIRGFPGLGFRGFRMLGVEDFVCRVYGFRVFGMGYGLGDPTWKVEGITYLRKSIKTRA